MRDQRNGEGCEGGRAIGSNGVKGWFNKCAASNKKYLQDLVCLRLVVVDAGFGGCLLEVARQAGGAAGQA